MRICANENIPEACVARLRMDGNDVEWVREIAPGSTDEEVIKRSQLESRVLITFDKDFGEWVFKLGATASCGVVLFRINQSSAESVARTVSKLLALRTDWQGHFSVLDEKTIRMRKLPGLG